MVPCEKACSGRKAVVMLQELLGEGSGGDGPAGIRCLVSQLN